MNELLQKLINEAGLTEQQAAKAMQTVRNYVVEKFPMMAGAVDKLLAAENNKNTEDPLG